MKHRWSKGKKEAKLPNGQKIIFLQVGGRTSAVVPSVQKKTGAVAADVQDSGSPADKDEPEDNKEEADVVEKGKKRKFLSTKQTKSNSKQVKKRSKTEAGDSDKEERKKSEKESITYEHAEQTNDPEGRHSNRRRSARLSRS
jgi:formamidopyrimidine-DNA glycosylase